MWIHQSQAEETLIQLEQISGKVNLVADSLQWQDPSDANWQQALSHYHQGQFTITNAATISEAGDNQNLWLLFNIKPVFSEENTGVYAEENIKHFYLEIGRPRTNEIDVFIIANDQLVHQEKFGNHRPYTELKIFRSFWTLKLPNKLNQEYQLLIRINTYGRLLVPLNLYDERTWQKHELATNVFYGIYFGTMCSLMLYNLFVFFGLRDVSYLFYILNLVGMAGFQLAETGFGYLFFWGANGNPPSSLISLFVSTSVASGTLFASFFLRTKTYAPRLNLLLWALSIATMLNFITFKIGLHENFIATFTVLLQIGSALVISASVLAILNGNKIANVFLLGWSVYLGGGLISLAAFHGAIDHTFFTGNALLFGAMFEAIVFSLALADRINSIQGEKVNLQLEALKNLSQSNRLKDEFLAIISHELRTPMNGVQGSLDLIRLEKPEHKIMSLVETADRSSAEMIKLIDNVLEFSEAQAGNLKVTEESFDLEKCLVELSAPLKRLCNSKSIHFYFNFDNQIPSFLNGMRIQTTKVLLHVLENAIKFTKEGNVTLSVSLDERTNVNSNQVWIQFRIADTGIGISPSKHEEIFNAFKQIDSSFTREYGGLGIGLATCQQTINILGGDISLTSEEGKGSTFIISLPFRVAHYDGLDEYQYSFDGVRHWGRYAILVVEDNPVNQKILRAILEKMDYEVFTADNGFESITAVEENAIDLIFMDCQMPVMDGYEASRAIRLKGPKFQQIPIVAVTANATTADLQRCIESGMNDTICKPVKKLELAEKLAKYLPKHKKATHI